ncbi:unnamed protein product [Lampetra fluviatilis]
MKRRIHGAARLSDASRRPLRDKRRSGGAAVSAEGASEVDPRRRWLNSARGDGDRSALQQNARLDKSEQRPAPTILRGGGAGGLGGGRRSGGGGQREPGRAGRDADGVNNNTKNGNSGSQGGQGGHPVPFRRQAAMRRLARCTPGERTARRATTWTDREAATTTTVPGRALRGGSPRWQHAPSYRNFFPGADGCLGAYHLLRSRGQPFHNLLTCEIV